MKKRILLTIIIFLTISVVSAAYTCDGTLSEDQDEIDVGRRKSINSLGIALISADETPVFNKISADLLVDAAKVTLTNETEEVELKSGDYSIELNNLTTNDAIIDVGGSYETIEVGDLGGVGGLEIYLLSITGSYPEGSADVLVGKERIYLSNDETPDKIAIIDNIDYLVEIISASDNDAIINVKKCDGGEFTEIEEESVENQDNETEQQSGSNITVSEENETFENITIQETEESQETEQENISSENQDVKIQGKYNYYIYIGVLIILIILIAFLFLYFKRRLKQQKEIEELAEYKK